MAKPVSRHSLFAGRIFEVGLEEHRLPNGRQTTFEVVRHPGGAAVLPVFADGRVLLIRQYRPAVGAMIYEIPAGRLEPGESPETCVARELVEEAGYRATEFLALGSLWSTVGFCDERVDLFVARGLSRAASSPEPDEVIELAPMPLEEALLRLERGEILDSKTQIALLRYARQAEEGA